MWEETTIKVDFIILSFMLSQVICYVYRSKTNKNTSSYHVKKRVGPEMSKFGWHNMWTAPNIQWRKVKQMQTVWLCLNWSKCAKDTFENTHRGKINKMQPVWHYIASNRPFGESSENTQWRKVKQMQPVHYAKVGVWSEQLWEINSPLIFNEN